LFPWVIYTGSYSPATPERLQRTIAGLRTEFRRIEDHPMIAVLAVSLTAVGSIAGWLAGAALALVLARVLVRRGPPALPGEATREFLVSYHQIVHENYGQQRPFARLRNWVQAETAGLTRSSDEFDRAAREFLTLGLAGLRQFAVAARNLGVSRGTVHRLSGAVDRLEAGLRGAMGPARDQRLGLARRAVQHMDEVSGACLDAYLEVVNRNPCRPEVELRTAVDSMSTGPSLGNVRFVMAAKPRDVPCVLFDPAALRGIAGELIQNAGRALTGVSEPEIRAEVVAHPTDSRYILVVVSDNGAGIPDDLRDRLFRPGASSRPDGGFGLARARDVSRAWLGDLDITNGPGGGAVATLKLRILANGPPAPDAPPPGASQRA
jgi:signal transduction histidine kinase